MATPEEVPMFQLEDIFEMKQEDLREELEKLGQDTKGLSKVQMQKNLAKLIKSTYSSPKLGMQGSGVQAESLKLKLQKELDEIARTQCKEDREAERRFELEKFKLQMDKENEAKKEHAELEMRKIEKEVEALERRLEKETEAKKEQAELEIRRVEKETEAFERKGQIELQNKKEEEERRIQIKKEEADALERKLRMEAEMLDRKMRIENERLAMELVEKEKLRQHQLQMKELGGSFERLTGGYFEDVANAEDNAERIGQTSRFNISSAVKFVPRFDDSNLEHYLQAFEKAMELHQFPKDKWSALIHTKLTGKALQIFGELSLEQCKDYEVVKQALLIAYARVPEYYRKRFREMTKGHLETYSNFAHRLSIPFESWLEGEDALSNVEKALEVFKLEQFVHCLPVDLHRWIVERKVSSLTEAARMADEYDLLGKPFKKAFVAPVKFGDQNWGNDTASGKKYAGKHSWGNPKNTKKYSSSFGTPVTCAYCNARTHTIAHCDQIRNRNSDRTNSYSDHGVNLIDLHSGNPAINQHYRSFVKDGVLYGSRGSRRSVVLLRDSGALQSVVSKDGLQACEYVLTGEDRLIQGSVGEAVKVPLVEISVESELVSGNFLCGLVDKLPNGINLLVGNDLVPNKTFDIAVVTRS